MGFTVRDLLPRIECMRPDLKMGEPERLTIAKAKHLMRECYLGQQTSLVYPVKAGVNQLLLSPDVKFKNPVTNGSLPSVPDIMTSAFGSSIHVDANKEVVPCVYGGARRSETAGIMDRSFNKLSANCLKVLRVKVVNFKNNNNSATFMGYVNGQANLPTVNSSMTGQFYINYGGAATDNNGDCWYCDGTQWNRYDQTTFSTMGQENWQSLNQWSNKNQFLKGNILSWSQRHGGVEILGSTTTSQVFTGMILEFYPTTRYDTAVEITYAGVPVDDYSDLDLGLPEEAKDPIVNGALADILALPGEHQNIQLSEIRREDWERGKSYMRALGATGLGGSAQYASPAFGGGYNSAWPHYYGGTW